MAQVHVIAGPAGSGKTERLLAHYRRALAAGPPGGCLWLAPTARSVVETRRRLLDTGFTGCFQPGCRTFSQFAQAVLDASPTRVRRLSDLAKRQLLRRLLDEAHQAGRLRYFAPIAQTEGLVDLLTGFIRELKRLEIWPDDFRAACRARGLTDKDRELADLYDRYQDLLTKHQLYDAEGRFWSARALLRDGQQRPFERVRLVVVDGFTDLTRTQHEILEILAGRVNELLISLPMEDVKGGREELFFKTRTTLDELTRRHPVLAVETLDRPARTVAALAHIERELFGNPRQPRPLADANGLEILAASGQLGEIDLIAVRIKQLLVEGDSSTPGATGSASAVTGATAGSSSSASTAIGISPVPPGDIAVVFRSLRDAAPLVREVFRELGIPFSLEAGRPLAEAPCLAALVSLLRLAVEDWPFRQVLATLSNNYFQPDWPEWRQPGAPAAVERLTRLLQIPRGSRNLLERIQRWANILDTPDADPEKPDTADDASSQRRRRMLRRRDQARLALPLVERLHRTLGLSKRGTPQQWVAALEALANETGLRRVIDSENNTDESGQFDRAAWDQLIATLRESEQLATWLDEPPPQWTTAEVLEKIQDVLRVATLPGDADEAGRVRVLSAPTARTLRVPYLFAAGLSERAFPPADHEDSLYGDREAHSLNQNGLRLSSRQERSADEMLLFYEVITRATRRLWLSYPALDDKAQPLLPSPYLVEVERACGANRIRRTVVPDLSPLPRGDEPLSPAAFRVMAVAQGLQTKPDLLAGLIQSQSVANNVLAGLSLTNDRRRGEHFGVFEGMIVGEEARTKVATRFGPLNCWSASQLEQYASCPHQFFLHRLLNLVPLEELSLQTDYLSRGGLLHDALARFHRRLHESTGGRGSPSKMKSVDFQQVYEETVQACVDQIRAEGLVDDALREVDRRLILEMGQRYLAQHHDYDQAWRDFDEPPTPTYFEVSFGPKRGDEPVDGISTEKPFELALGDETIQLSGRVDRIDIGRIAGQLVFNLLDYKSGTSVKLDREAIKDGRLLQLPLYTLAVQQMLLAGEHAVPWRVGYWQVKQNGFQDKDVLTAYELAGDKLAPTPEWKTLVGTVLARVESLIGGVRDAQFPMHSADEKCTSRCSFRTVCRVHQVRALNKTWQPPVPQAKAST